MKTAERTRMYLRFQVFDGVEVGFVVIGSTRFLWYLMQGMKLRQGLDIGGVRQ